MLAGIGIAVCVGAALVVWVAADHRLRTHGPYAVTRHPKLIPGLHALHERHSPSS
jgi:protein-S-isoprenylcysteine O-methyltransferase Ste14